MNFASPVELPKKLTVRENLEIYSRLYGLKKLKSRIEEISEDLNLTKFLEKKQVSYLLDKKIGFLLRNL